jgi:hypothetical protein
MLKLNVALLGWLITAATVAPSLAKAQDGVLITCGASIGTGYFFKDDLTNPNGPSWEEDGISSGKIVLVKLGDEWDIQFDDAAGAYGYRQDGAAVLLLSQNDGMMTIGAFHPNYADVYTFNFEQGEVLWSSHKIGTAIKKAAIYRAECSS